MGCQTLALRLRARNRAYLIARRQSRIYGASEVDVARSCWGGEHMGFGVAGYS